MARFIEARAVMHMLCCVARSPERAEYLSIAGVVKKRHVPLGSLDLDLCNNGRSTRMHLSQIAVLGK